MLRKPAILLIGASMILARVAYTQAVETAAPEIAPRNGMSVTEPPGEPIERTYGLLIGTAVSQVAEPGFIDVMFTTAAPTPPAMVYAGLTDVREELPYPRYRFSFPEKAEGMMTEHRIRLDIKSMTSKMPNTEFEPYINWRAEVWVPSMHASRFIEGRTYFHKETLGDTTNILMGPIVDQVTGQDVLVAFETDRPMTARVEIEGLPPTVIDTPAMMHQVRVQGLAPNREYRYRVQAGETVTSWKSFRTAGSETFEFAAMVDSREGVGGGMQNNYGVNAAAVQALASGAWYRGADFVVFAGDLTNGYTTRVDEFRNMLHSFRRSVEPVHQHIPIYESMGNHEALINCWQVDRARVSIDKDGDESAEALFAEVFYNPENGPENEGPGTPTYRENVYTFDWGPARFVMLNNNYWWSSDPHRYGGNLEGYILPNQMDWLREEVARADSDDAVKFIFYAAQEPPFPNGGHTADAMWYRGGDTNRDRTVDDRDIKIIENRNEMWQIIASSPKSVAFITGDEHAYSRVIIAPGTNVGHRRLHDGREAEFKHAVWQVTSGGAGAPWYDKELDLPWSPWLKAHSTQPHYAFFRVDGDSVDLEAYSQTGQRIDSASLRRAGRNLDW